MSDEVFRKPIKQAFGQIFKPAIQEYRRAAEGERVQALVKAMADYEMSERIRKRAEQAAVDGDPTALNYLRLEPTPEWLAKGNFDTVEALPDHWQAKPEKVKRRRQFPIVYELYATGLIDQEQLNVCRWYRDCWEATGLVGNIPSTDYAKEVFSAPNSRSMFTEWHIESQEIFRKAQGAITVRYVGFFDGVVLEDQGLQKAIKRARRRESAAKGVFKQCVEELQTAYDKLKRY